MTIEFKLQIVSVVLGILCSFFIFLCIIFLRREIILENKSENDSIQMFSKRKTSQTSFPLLLTFIIFVYVVCARVTILIL